MSSMHLQRGVHHSCRFGPDKSTLLRACFRRQMMMFLRNYAFIAIRM